MVKRKAKRKLKIDRLLITAILIFLLFYTIYDLVTKDYINSDELNKVYIASSNAKVFIYDKKLKKISELSRGSLVYAFKETIKDKQKNITYTKIRYDYHLFYINKANLTSDKKNIIQEKKIYVRTPATLYSDLDKGTIAGLSSKGASLDVVGYNKIDKNGEIDAYAVKHMDGTSYIYRKYVVLDENKAKENYEPTKYYNVHAQRGDRFGGGNASNLDYFPVTKPVFKDNKMPSKVYALYLNSNVLNNVDKYIDYAKKTKINAFVVDIKDNEAPGYKSKVFEQYSPTNYQKAHNSLDGYKKVIKKIKDAGYYVIGRITVFKDKYYILDNPDVAILDSRTGKPYLTANTYWPNPFQRRVWQFNVNLAKEAVKEMGFNEIQFDYVRFPDRTQTDEKNGIIVYRNDYKEEKAQAIQRFLMYASDELHKLNVYVAADVFGESAYNYVTAYGQYWASISNVVDVISGMPYPDHFNKYEFDFTEPVWTTPYKLLNYWGSKYVVQRQKEIPTPAILRTWIQVSDVPNYKHPGGYVYGEKQIDEEIRALFDAGLTGGYMTWLSNSKLSRYESQINIYKKEY